MAKQLKQWNGGGYGHPYQNQSLYVAAYSKKQCAELVSLVCTNEVSKNWISVKTISDYYSPCWGKSMEHINIEDVKYPSVWAQKNYNDAPKLVFELKTDIKQ